MTAIITTSHFILRTLHNGWTMTRFLNASLWVFTQMIAKWTNVIADMRAEILCGNAVASRTKNRSGGWTDRRTDTFGTGLDTRECCMTEIWISLRTTVNGKNGGGRKRERCVYWQESPSDRDRILWFPSLYWRVTYEVHCLTSVTQVPSSHWMGVEAGQVTPVGHWWMNKAQPPEGQVMYGDGQAVESGQSVGWALQVISGQRMRGAGHVK